MVVLLTRCLSRIAAIALLAGLIGATLIRLGPGFGTSVEELDPRLSEATRNQIRRENGMGLDVAEYYGHWLGGIVRGDLGFSPSLKRPVAELLRERAKITAVEVAGGTAAGVLLGFLVAVMILASSREAGNLIGGVAGAVALSVPAAVVALVCLWFDASPVWAVAAAVFPYALHYLTGVLRGSAASEHVLAARARGVGAIRVLFVHVVTPVAGQLAAVVGLAVSIALGASIPIEAICSRPGIGQLVWQASLARDLPVLVNMTVLLAVVTVGANTLSDVAVAAFGTAGRRGL